MALGLGIGLTKARVLKTIAQAVRAILNRLGSDGHMWLPGTGTKDGFVTGNYLDSTGTTPATIDGSRGLVLDAAGSVGAELVTNGDFSNGTTGWTGGGSVVDGKLVVGLYSQKAQAITVKANTSYKVTFDVDASAGSGRISVGSTLIDSLNTSKVGASYIIKTVDTAGLTCGCISGTSCGYDNISVSEVTGLHLSQPTAGYKPVERKGIVNLLTWSNDLSNAAWVTSGVTKITGGFAEDTANSAHLLARFTTWTAATQSTASFRVKAGTATKCWIGNASAATGVCFDLTTGTIEGAIGSITGTIAPDSDGYYLIAATHTAASAQTLALGIYTTFVSGSYNGTFVFLGSGRTLLCSAGAIFQGTLTASQIQQYGGIPLTTTAAASSALGPNYWAFDGVDDRLSLSAVPFQMSDDHCVVVAAKTSRSAGFDQVMFAIRSAGNGTPIVCLLRFVTGGTIQCLYRDDAGNSATLSGPSFAVETIYVVAVRKVGTSLVLRVNGVQVATATAPSGAFTVDTCMIGAGINAGTVNNQMLGAIYHTEAHKMTASESDIIQMEKYAASCAGGRLVGGAFVSNI